MVKFGDKILAKNNVSLILEVEGTCDYTKNAGNRERERFRISFNPPWQVLISSLNGFRKFVYDGAGISHCADDSEHCCGASGFGLSVEDYCPVCDSYSEARYILEQIIPTLRERGYLREKGPYCSFP